MATGGDTANGLLVAEATPPAALVGKPLRDSGLRNETGLTVAGVWERGELHVARPTTVLAPSSISFAPVPGARARFDRNVSTLHRAGADAVLSYASPGATALWNVLSDENTLQIAEGLDVFRVPLPDQLVGRTLEGSGIRETTGCTVVAMALNGRLEASPDAHTPLPPGADLVLIGDAESEHRFLHRFRSGRR